MASSCVACTSSEGAFGEGQGVCFEASAAVRDTQWKYVGEGKGQYKKMEPVSEVQAAGWTNCMAKFCCVVCFLLVAASSVYTVLVLAALVPLPNGTRVQLQMKSQYSFPFGNSGKGQGSASAKPFIKPAGDEQHDLVASADPVTSSTAAPLKLRGSAQEEFDCNQDYLLWETAWSPAMKEYCCKVKDCSRLGLDAAQNEVASTFSAVCPGTCNVNGKPTTCANMFGEELERTRVFQGEHSQAVVQKACSVAIAALQKRIAADSIRECSCCPDICGPGFQLPQ